MTDPETLPPILGTGEAARACGVSVSYFVAATSAGGTIWPAPDGRLNGRYAWWWRETIEAWLAGAAPGTLRRSAGRTRSPDLTVAQLEELGDPAYAAGWGKAAVRIQDRDGVSTAALARAAGMEWRSVHSRLVRARRADR